MSEKFSSKKLLPELEREVLEFWETNKIFEKSIKARQGAKLFSFYDGPPFANGQPHYGHILATTIKDTVTRYKTMRGFLVNRRVGWDCHGLPVEVAIDKELGVKSKKDIEEKIGIEKYNQACRESVFNYAKDFETVLRRVGRWADYSDSYATIDTNYTESVWWVFKQLWDAGLVYKDYRVSAYCPRCGTPLSNFEVNQGYKDTNDPSVFVKFQIIRKPFDKLRVDSFDSAQDKEFFLVWTTTPWTLPANSALAVGAKIKYVKIQLGDEKLILAKDRLSVIEGDYKILEEFDGKKLKGIEYEPLYSFTVSAVASPAGQAGLAKEDKLKKKAHYVVLADFVSVEDGTGIVHIAPAFGEDDLNIGRANDLPVILTIDNEGKFLPEVSSWAGKFVKNVDQEIIKELESRGLMFKSQRISHSYPFCWRCDTPLLYMALDSWYIRVTDFRDDLVKNNQKINWRPEHIKDGRFGKWLETARDWDFGRSRYWGAPLPIWQCEKCKKQIAIGSRQELLSKIEGTNELVFVRRGQAEHNILGINNGDVSKNHYSLTKKGKEQVEALTKEIGQEKFDFVFASGFLRVKETAEILTQKLKKEIIIDNRLGDIYTGDLEGKTVAESREYRANAPDYFNSQFPNGESLADVAKRTKEFLEDIGKKYSNKKILIVSHQDTIKTIFYHFGLIGQKNIDSLDRTIAPATAHRFFQNEKVNISDLHRPYIDEVEINCECGGKTERVKEVFDCWFESGSMPYAQWHYPFENKELVESTYPADFIAEGIDQTRGWFYTLNVLATALTQKDTGLGLHQPAFKNVIVNGILLAENGQKLSKKLKNYTDPTILFERIGADALRYFLLASTAIGEDYRVSDKRIEELYRRVIMTFWNVYLFFESYSGGVKIDFSIAPTSDNLLDKWMLSRVNHASQQVAKYMDDYDLTRGVRVVGELVDELSNWYVRRSRRRFQKEGDKKDKEMAIKVLGYAIEKTCLLSAPFMPFISEVIYKKINGKMESVHLADFPTADKKLINKDLENVVTKARQIISLGLASRAEAKVKVRQPLAEVKVKDKDKSLEENKEILEQICEELNVKQIVFGAKIEKEVELNLEMTKELREEGTVREIGRQIQSLRKEMGLAVGDKINIQYSCDDKELADIIVKNSAQLAEEVGAKSIALGKGEFKNEIEVGGQKIRITALLS